MLRETQRLCVIFTLIAMWASPETLSAGIAVMEGNEPVENKGWPTGAEKVANLPGRLGYMVGPPFGGGEYYFKYHCSNTAEFNHALRKFGKIQAPRTTRRSLISLDGQITHIMDEKPLLLVVHNRPRDASPEDPGTEIATGGRRVDWTLTIWIPENFHSLFSGPTGSLSAGHPNFRQPVPAPRIDVYLAGASPIVWQKAEVPPDIRVIDKRANSAPVNLDGGAVIKGRLFDMATHRLITGADVILLKRTGLDPRKSLWNNVAQAKTDNNGSFKIQAIPKGYYEIHVRANGYAARNVGVFHNRNGHTFHEFDAFLMKAASCRGVVQNEEGDPIPAARVYAEEMLGIDGLGYKCPVNPSATTDEQGRFELNSLPGGFVHIRCTAPSMHQKASIFDIYRVSTKPWDEPEEIKIVMSAARSSTK